MVLQKLWVSQNLIVLIFGGCVHLAVSIFLQKCLGVSFFVRLQSLAVPTCLSVFYIYINDKNISCLHLKNFDVLLSQFKKSKCLGVAKKNASLAFSQSLHFSFATPNLLSPLCIFLFLYPFLSMF